MTTTNRNNWFNESDKVDNCKKTFDDTMMSNNLQTNSATDSIDNTFDDSTIEDSNQKQQIISSSNMEPKSSLSTSFLSPTSLRNLDGNNIIVMNDKEMLAKEGKQTLPNNYCNNELRDPLAQLISSTIGDIMLDIVPKN